MPKMCERVDAVPACSKSYSWTPEQKVYYNKKITLLLISNWFVYVWCLFHLFAWQGSWTHLSLQFESHQECPLHKTKVKKFYIHELIDNQII